MEKSLLAYILNPSSIIKLNIRKSTKNSFEKRENPLCDTSESG